MFSRRASRTTSTPTPLSPRGGRRWVGRHEADRGDVPGWVLITLMTAGLVAAIWAVAGPALVDLFDSAISSVSGD